MSAGSRKDLRFRTTTIALCVAVLFASSASANSSNISKSRLKQCSQQAETLEALAQRLDVHPGGLAGTVSRYNRDCAAGVGTCGRS